MFRLSRKFYSTCLPTCSGLQKKIHPLLKEYIYFFLKELYISIIVCQIFVTYPKKIKFREIIVIVGKWRPRHRTSLWEVSHPKSDPTIKKKLSQDSCEAANAKISIVFHFNSETVLLQSRSQKKPKFPTLSHFSKKFSKPEKIFSNQLLQLQSKAFLGALLLNRVFEEKIGEEPYLFV
jgi:hypothetical protein